MNEKVKNRLQLINYKIKVMKDYLEHFNEYFNTLQKKAREDYIQQYNHYDELGNLSLQLEYMEIFNKNDLFFPQLHYSSFLVSWYSFVESELKNFCIFCNKELKLEKSTNGLKGYYSMKQYINDVIGVPTDKEKWDEIKCLLFIRNKIAHLGPDFDKKLNEYSDEDIRSYIDTHELIKEGKYTALYITYEFCIHLLDFASNLFWGIYNSINKFEENQ